MANERNTTLSTPGRTTSEEPKTVTEPWVTHAPERDEKLVEPFLKDMGEKMTYRVSLDDKTTSKKGTMAETWMDAAGRNGIPSAFLVNTEGKIAWIGHPMELKDSVIDDVLAGKYDMSFIPELSQQAFDEFHRCGVPCEISWLPCGHYTMGEFPFSALAGYRIVRFLRKLRE